MGTGQHPSQRGQYLKAIRPPGTPSATACPFGRKCSRTAQQLAHGYCVQAFHDLVDEDRNADKLDDTRKAAWCYVALAMDKLISTNSLLCRWHPNRQVVAGTFDSHDYGMKWSYAEMAYRRSKGWGLEWAVNDCGRLPEADHPDVGLPAGGSFPKGS